MIRALVMGAKSGNTNVLTPTKIQTYSARGMQVAQTSSVTIPAYSAPGGETFTITINGKSKTYTSAVGSTSTTALNGLVTLVNADTDISPFVNISRSASTDIISSKIGGLPFTLSASDTAASVDITYSTPTISEGGNCWDIDFGLLSFDVGDVIKIALDGVETSYTVPSEMTSSNVVTAFALLTNANGVFYNRFKTNILTVLANSYTTDVVLSCSVTNS